MQHRDLVTSSQYAVCTSCLACDGQRTGNVPLRTVLRPQTDTVVVAGDANLLVNLNQASAKVLATLGNLGIGSPSVLVLPVLGRRVPCSVTQALCVGALLGGLLKQVVNGLDGRIKSGQQRAVAEAPMAVDGAAPFLLGAWNRDSVG